MSTVMMKNNQEGDAKILPPIHEDGSTFIYCMYYNQDQDIVFADTTGELLNTLTPGYLKASPEDKDFLRIRLAQRIAAEIQADLLVKPAEHLSDEEWDTAITPKNTSIKTPTLWTSKVPLILVETSYVPYTPYERPTSPHQGYAAENLWWIRPQEEEDFLVSLHEIGYIRIMASTENEN